MLPRRSYSFYPTSKKFENRPKNKPGLYYQMLYTASYTLSTSG